MLLKLVARNLCLHSAAWGSRLPEFRGTSTHYSPPQPIFFERILISFWWELSVLSLPSVGSLRCVGVLSVVSVGQSLISVLVYRVNWGVIKVLIGTLINISTSTVFSISSALISV